MWYTGSLTGYLTGKLGPVAVWHRTLSDAEVNALAGGLEFRWLKPVHYWECMATGDETDQIGSLNMTEVGSVTQYSDHPVLRRRLVMVPGTHRMRVF